MFSAAYWVVIITLWALAFALLINPTYVGAWIGFGWGLLAVGLSVALIAKNYRTILGEEGD